MTDLHTWYTVAVIVLVTAALRFLPFIVFRDGQKTPEIIKKLGNLLPFAVMGMLVVFCLKDLSFTNVSSYLPALIACLLVGVLYVWKRNTLISILCGTVCYMLLVQIVF